MGRGVNRRRERIMAMPPIAGDINLLMEGGKEHVSDTGVDDGVDGVSITRKEYMDARFGGSVCIGDYVMESGGGWWKNKGRRYEKWLRLAKKRLGSYNKSVIRRDHNFINKPMLVRVPRYGNCRNHGLFAVYEEKIMKTAVLVDGGFYRKRATALWGMKTPEDRAKELYGYCMAHMPELKKWKLKN